MEPGMTNYRFAFTKEKEKEKHDQSSVTLLNDSAKSNKTLKFNHSITK